MKKFNVTTVLVVTAVIGFLSASPLSAKCGGEATKCGSDKKTEKCGASKCGGEKKTPKPVQKCGASKCGADKKAPKVAEKCGKGKCG